MEHTQIVLGFLFPTDQDAPEAVHPTVRSFHHPASGFESRTALQQSGLFAASANVGRKPELAGQVTDFIIVISLVQRQVLRLVQAGPRLLDRNTLDRFPSQFEIIDVGAGGGQADRDALGLDQQTALGAGFGPIRVVGPSLFPPRAEPWSWRRPCSTTTSPIPSGRHTTPIPFSTIFRIRRQHAIPGSADAPSNWSKCRWHSENSIGRQFAECERWHPSRPGSSFAADPRRRGVDSWVWATGTRQTTTTHPAFATSWP